MLTGLFLFLQRIFFFYVISNFTSSCRSEIGVLGTAKTLYLENFRFSHIGLDDGVNDVCGTRRRWLRTAGGLSQVVFS